MSGPFTQAWQVRIPDFSPMFEVAVRAPDGDTFVEWSPALLVRYPAIALVPGRGPGRIENNGVPYVSTKRLREHFPEDKDLQDFLVKLAARIDEAVAEAKTEQGC
jgi:hypothetical protein